MNDKLWPYDIRGRMWLKFPGICLTVEKNPGKKPQTGNWPDWKSISSAGTVVLGVTTLLTSQVINVAFYSEREMSDNFFSEVLISAWGSCKCRIIIRIFTLWKNPSTLAGFEPANLGSNSEYDNHGSTGVDPVIESGPASWEATKLPPDQRISLIFKADCI